MNHSSTALLCMEGNTKKVKYFTKDLLIAANTEAIRTNRNRNLHPDRLKALPDLNFPVGMTLVHNDCEIRVEIIVGPDADHLHSVWLDVPFETYNGLPEVELPA